MNVEVYDANGAKLPVASDTGNPILAKGVMNVLRIEAFPPGPDDEPLDRQEFRIDPDEDPIAENSASTLTELRDSSMLVTDNENYLNIPYGEGQVGYLALTPVGTGEGVIVLRDGDGSRVQNHAGEDIVFDVLRQNLEVSLGLDRESVPPGGSLTATVTAAATGEPVGLAEVTMSDTNGNVISALKTNENGIVSLSVPESAQLGEYSLETRPAGYQPIAQSFQVRSPAQLDTDLTLYPRSEQVISGTSSAEVGTRYTIETAGPGYLEDAEAEVQADGTFSAVFDLRSLSAGDELTASIPETDETTYTLQSPPAATITMHSQVSQDGDIVVVDEVFLPEGGYVVIHNASSGSVVGNTGYFEPGTYNDIDILLDQRLAGGSNQIVAMPHLDTNGNQTYDFPDADGPYTADGTPVTDTATVSVSAESANFEVTDLDAPSIVKQGESVTASARIENTGNLEATQMVEFQFDGETIATQNVTLGSDGSQAVDFTVGTTGIDAGTHTYGVYTNDDSQTAGLTIETRTTTPQPPESTTERPVFDPTTETDSPLDDGSGGGDTDDSELPWLPLGAGVAVSVAGLVGWLTFGGADDRPAGNAGGTPPSNGGGASPPNAGGTSPPDAGSAHQSAPEGPGSDAGQSPTNIPDRGPSEQASGDGQERQTTTETRADDPDQRPGEQPPAASPATETNQEPPGPEGVRAAGTESPLSTAVRELSNVNRLSRRGPLDAYTAVHADVTDPVRVLAVGNGVDVNNDLEARFNDAVHGWRNLSSHENVVTLQDWGTNPVPWVATEMVANTTPFGEYSAEPDVLLDVLSDVVEPINTASLYSATHGNLTDETILIADTEQGPAGLVDDWGVRRVIEEASGQPVLTPYTAPEQLETGSAGRSTEVFALGALAYEALTGEPPFPETGDEERYLDAVRRGPTPPSERSTADPALDGPILRALAADPERRHSSVTSFEAALRNER